MRRNQMGLGKVNGRASWFPLGLSLVMALAMVVGILQGVPAAPGHPHDGELLTPVGGQIHTQNADYLSSFAPFAPGELWAQGSPVEQCAPCNLRTASGAAAGQSVQPGQEVNPATGDFNFSHQLDSVPTVGGNLGMTLTYDANRALAVQGQSSPIFGVGWQSSLFPTETSTPDSQYPSLSDYTVNQQNGSEDTFFGQPPTNSTCTPPGDDARTFKYTIPNDRNSDLTQENFCAPARVDAQVGSFADGYVVYNIRGGTSNIYFSSSTGLPAGTGNWTYPGDLVSYTYNATPGTGGCPTTSSFGTPVSCDFVADSAGRKDVVVLGAPPTYPTATGLVLQANDPMSSVTFGWAWKANQPLPLEPASIVMNDPATVSQWAFGYNNSTVPAFLTGITNADNHTQTIGYNSYGQVQTLTDFAAANTTTYSYGNESCLNTDQCLGLGETESTTVGYPDGEVDTDNYEQGLLDYNAYGTSNSGSDQSQIGYSYNFPQTQGGSIQEQIVVLLGTTYKTWTIATDGLGNVTGLTDANNNQFSSFYNETNNFDEMCWSAPVAMPPVPSCSSPPTGAATFAYNLLDGQLSSKTDPNGNTTNYGFYNDMALCYVEPPTVSGSGSSCGVPYGSPTGAPAGSAAYSYDTYGDLTNQYAAYGTSSQTTQTASYDADGEKVFSYPPNAYAQGTVPGSPNASYKSSSIYKDLLLSSTTTPMSRTTSYTYDAMGNTLTSTDPTGATTTAYDADGRTCWSDRRASVLSPAPACTAPPSGSTSKTYSFDTSAVLSSMDPDGHTTTYQYYNVAYPTLPTKVIDPMSAAVTNNFYDMAGNLCVSGPVIPSSCAWSTGDTFKTFDGLGNVLLNEDPKGNYSVTGYQDTRFPKLPTSVDTLPLGTTAYYTYDANGQKVSQYSDDIHGNLVNLLSFGYDAGGRPCYVNLDFTSDTCTSVDNVPSNTMYTYDARGNLASMVDYNGTGSPPTSTFSYDNNGKVTQEIDDNASTISYTYDAGSDLTCVAYPVHSGANCANQGSTSNTVVKYGYDSAGRQTSSADWLGHTTQYSYTGDGRSNVDVYQYGSTSGEATYLGINLDSNLLSMTYYGGALATSQSWNRNADELVSSTTQLNDHSTDTYDGAHNWVAGATNPGSSGADAYGYNTNGELASDTPPAHSAISYSYQADSQLQTVANPNTGINSTYAENALGQRCWSAPSNISSPSCASPPANASSYAFNALGQLCWTGQTNAPTQNACGSIPSGATGYTYDGAGCRMTATTGSTTTKYDWDVVSGGSLPRLIDDGTNAYIYGPSTTGNPAPVEQINLATNAPTYLSSTPAGVQVAFNQANTLLNESSYSTYGSQSNTSSSASPFGFQGGYTDPSGLIFLQNRYYDPNTGQFISVDPMFADTGQAYAYAGDDPINGSDPTGLEPQPPQWWVNFMFGVWYVQQPKTTQHGRATAYRLISVGFGKVGLSWSPSSTMSFCQIVGCPSLGSQIGQAWQGISEFESCLGGGLVGGAIGGALTGGAGGEFVGAFIGCGAGIEFYKHYNIDFAVDPVP